MTGLALPGDPESWLQPPVAGDSGIRHDPTFARWDDSFSGTRDLANDVLAQINDILRRVGFDLALPILPTGSLEDLLILPLTGDYDAIRRNADACRRLGDALDAWAGNFACLAPGALLVDWEGAAAAAFVRHACSGSVAASAASGAMPAARGAFARIADGCEQFAVVVERAVVRLGKALARLVRTALRRLAGLAAVAVLAVDLARKGIGVFLDVLADIRAVLDAVNELRRLHQQVTDWVSQRAADLHRVRDVIEELRRLRTTR